MAISAHAAPRGCRCFSPSLCPGGAPAARTWQHCVLCTCKRWDPALFEHIMQTNHYTELLRGMYCCFRPPRPFFWHTESHRTQAKPGRPAGTRGWHSRCVLGARGCDMKRTLRARGRKGKKKPQQEQSFAGHCYRAARQPALPMSCRMGEKRRRTTVFPWLQTCHTFNCKDQLLPLTTLCTFMLFAGADLLQGTALPRSLIRENQGHGHVRWRPLAEAIAAVHTGHTTSPGTSTLLACTLPHAEGGTRSSAIKTKAADRAYDAVFPAAKGLLPSAPPGSPLPLLLFAI